jgi:hypothetical protein
MSDQPTDAQIQRGIDELFMTPRERFFYLLEKLKESPK